MSSNEDKVVAEKKRADAWLVIQKMKKEEKDAKITGIRNALLDQAYVSKRPPPLYTSRAFDTIRRIYNAETNEEIYCAYYCIKCHTVYLWCTSKGTYSLITHQNSCDPNKADKADEADKADKADSAVVADKTSTPNVATNTAGVSAVSSLPGKASDSSGDKETGSPKYHLSADELTNAFASVSDFAVTNGRLDALAFKKMLPDPGNWSMEWLEKAKGVAALLNVEYPSDVSTSESTSNECSLRTEHAVTSDELQSIENGEPEGEREPSLCDNLQSVRCDAAPGNQLEKDIFPAENQLIVEVEPKEKCEKSVCDDPHAVRDDLTPNEEREKGILPTGQPIASSETEENLECVDSQPSEMSESNPIKENRPRTTRPKQAKSARKLATLFEEEKKTKSGATGKTKPGGKKSKRNAEEPTIEPQPSKRVTRSKSNF